MGTDTMSKEGAAAVKAAERDAPSVRLRFWELLHAKSRRVGRRITPRSVILETGLPKNVIYDMTNDTLRELPLWIVGPLCRFLECNPGDLLEWSTPPTVPTP